MIEQKIQFNPAQQIGVLLQAKNKADIWGRGTGKSAGIAWDINLINRTMSQGLNRRNRTDFRTATHTHTSIHFQTTGSSRIQNARLSQRSRQLRHQPPTAGSFPATLRKSNEVRQFCQFFER